MKKFNIITLASAAIVVVALFAFNLKTVEAPPAEIKFTSFTVVESIVPNGFGRSRLITSLEPRDYKEYTSVKSAENKERNKSDRGDIRVDNYEETKLLNFYNVGGIRFQNIAANDALINNKVSTMLNEGWELINIVSGVESVGGKDDSHGIYITRFYFSKTIS
jgi:hypothetical protein